MTTKICYTINNVGTAAFPIYAVWSDPEDENGYLIEHESVELARFVTYNQALKFLNSYTLNK